MAVPRPRQAAPLRGGGFAQGLFSLGSSLGRIGQKRDREADLLARTQARADITKEWNDLHLTMDPDASARTRRRKCERSWRNASPR